MCKIQAMSIKTLENQIGQIANVLLNRPQGTLPSDTEANLGRREVKEKVRAVTLRSGKATKQPQQAEEQNVKISGTETGAPAPYTGAPAPLSGEKNKNSTNEDQEVIEVDKMNVSTENDVP